MQENLITWNFTNWVTIVLMALVGFFVLGTLVSFLKSKGVGSATGALASSGQSAQAAA